MRRVLVGLLSLLVSGCPPSDDFCNRNPGDEACVPDATPIGGLIYRTRTGPTGPAIIGECGAYTRVIDWLYPGGAPEDGFIVQKVESFTAPLCPSEDDFELLTCGETVPPGCADENGDLIDTPFLWVYWETWPIRAGATVSEGQDTWTFRANAAPEGASSLVGEARYYRDTSMGDEHPEHPDSPFARWPERQLDHRWPTTTREPRFWRDDPRRTLTREVRLSWRCCPPEPTRVEEDTHEH